MADADPMNLLGFSLRLHCYLYICSHGIAELLLCLNNPVLLYESHPQPHILANDPVCQKTLISINVNYFSPSHKVAKVS